MEKTPEIFDQIEGYINNTLSHEQLATFKKEIAANPKLKREVEQHKAIHKTLSDKDTLKFKKKLIRINNTIKEQETVTPISLFSSYWKIAASLIVILGIGTLLWNTMTNNNNNNADLYIAYYEPFMAEDITRGKNNTKLLNIIKNYNKGDYHFVINTLEKFPDIINEEQAHLYLGNSYLNTNQEKKAIVQFKSIKKNNTNYEIGRWYLSLTYLKIGEYKKTISLLEEVIEYNGIYKNNAIQLKKALLK